MGLDVSYPVCHHVTVGEDGDCGWCVWECSVVKAHGLVLLSVELFDGLISIQPPSLLMKHFDSVQPYSMNTVSLLVASANFAQAVCLFCCAILPAIKNVRTSTSVMLSTPMMKSRTVLVILLAAFLGVRQPQQPVL